MTAEATNIARRLVRVLAQLDPSEYGYVRKCARSLDPSDIRALAREITALNRPRPVVQHGPWKPVPPPPSPVSELRGVARSIIRYGGADAVRRDAGETLVDALNQVGWTK